jgi:gliding motility-associated-like protein
MLAYIACLIIMKNKEFILLMILAAFLSATESYALDIEFSGSRHTVIKDKPEASTGLNDVFTIYDIKEVSFISIGNIIAPSDFRVLIYSNLGGGYAIEQPVSITGTTAFIHNPKGDMGYIVEDGGNRYCFWVVDYAGKHFDISSIEAYPEQDCDMTKITVIGSGDQIRYYSVSGRQCTLSRNIELSYNTLEWDNENNCYSLVEKTDGFEYLQTPLTLRPPFYCNTTVTVSGDRFLKTWGLGKTLESSIIEANGIDVNTEAVQTNLAPDDASNMIKSDGTMLGGSAPADFTFYAYVTDAVLHNEWQIADDPEFEYVRYRFNERDLTYTFDQEGKFYVRFIGSNADGSCEATGETYEIGIGASDLRIPNVFSPDGDGVNDTWKVGYRSLVEFKCWIFDRNGHQLFYFDRPELGWDGKHHGKTVSPGVYYYVIEAKGADGKKYKKGGDINILRYRKIGNSSGASGE